MSPYGVAGAGLQPHAEVLPMSPADRMLAAARRAGMTVAAASTVRLTVTVAASAAPPDKIVGRVIVGRAPSVSP